MFIVLGVISFKNQMYKSVGYLWIGVKEKIVEIFPKWYEKKM